MKDENLERYEKVVEELLEQISERNQRITLLSSKLQHCEETVNLQENQIKSLSEQIADLNSKLSASGKINRILLALSVRIVPRGSARERIVKKLFREKDDQTHP
jgi:chromosome segregation ATPase